MKSPIKVKYELLKDLDYKEGWDRQTGYHEKLKEEKLAQRDVDPEERSERNHILMLCEHRPVYTLGKSGSMDNLLLSEAQLEERGIDFYPINRGGDITYHGPGQITGYPIFDLDDFYHDVKKYVFDLEEVMIRVLEKYDLVGKRIEGYTGVWIGDQAPYRKICAIGVHMSRWVTLHGFAFNIDTDLNYFRQIIPCGIVDEDKDVTSLSKELGRKVEMEEVLPLVKAAFEEVYNITLEHE